MKYGIIYKNKRKEKLSKMKTVRYCISTPREVYESSIWENMIGMNFIFVDFIDAITPANHPQIK